MADAWLYEVRMARGTVYALRDVGSGKIWTERSEYGARQLAWERRLTITREQSISHEDLLRLLGHEPIPKSSPAGASFATGSPSAAPVEDQGVKDAQGSRSTSPAVDAPAPAFSFPVRYHLEDEPEPLADDANVISLPASQQAKGVFCSDGVITPKTEAEPPEKSSDRPVSNR